MLIVEPQILIPTTQIVKAFPCARKAYLNNQFKSLSGDINYALVLGNIVHAIFQAILQCLDFRKETIDKIVEDAIKGDLLPLFALKKSESEVFNDARRGVAKITEWIDMVLQPSKNKHKLKFEKFIAAE
jgi:hypothetical protein